MSVVITSPLGTAYVRDAVTVQVAVHAGTPDSVELLLDGNVLAKLVAPYQYTWATTHVPEGQYQLTARVHRGSTTAVSPHLEVVVDRTPPELISRSPTPGSPEEWTGAISFTASEPLLVASLTDSSVQLRAGTTPVRAQRELSTDGKTVRVACDEPLSLPVDMTLDVTEQVSDLAGNHLIRPTGVWSWHAPAWRLLGASVHSEPGRYAVSTEQPSLVVLPNGKPVVAFEEWNSVGPSMTLKSIVAQWDGGDWRSIGPPNTYGSGRLALGLDNVPHFAWTVDRTDFHLLRRDGAAWTPIHESTGNGYSSINRFLFGIGPRGRAGISVTWFDSASSSSMSSVHVGGSGPWTEVLPPRRAEIFSLAIDSLQRPWVVYQDAGSNELRVLRLEGTQISAVGDSLQVEAGSSSGSAYAADLKFAADGTPVVAWRDVSSLYVQRWNGTAWTKVGNAQSVLGFGFSKQSVSLALAPEDDAPAVAVVQYSMGQEVSELRVVAWDGSGWNTLLSGVPADRSSEPLLALMSAGRVVVAWVAPANASEPGPAMLRVRANH
ncbi:Ig-like domain-containing protein [Myxococcus sp. CA051A]|uniref:Ig-like domain-containing protein n=1 Tax=unclassified Myxococcus TaxID=2648731 RepID=UPI00157A4512|nr:MULTISPECIES: Ig-like domain-containing protein [unclassified Myxococcus]NTX40536.1 Ig-like domain-containing protein [Myxococcus sp. CA033]NTX62875.1 Ig-like domain-containing protein [Myxococcus sp. CA051A]